MSDLPRVIHYALGSLGFSNFLLAKSAKGICALLLGKSNEDLSKELFKSFPKARFIENQEELEEDMKAVRNCIKNPHAPRPTLDLHGTDFRSRVWDELCKIPYGETICYSELAKRINKPTGARAVAQACGANPVAILVPCHRVIGKDGSLTGFASGLSKKAHLLSLEKEILGKEAE